MMKDTEAGQTHYCAQGEKQAQDLVTNDQQRMDEITRLKELHANVLSRLGKEIDGLKLELAKKDRKLAKIQSSTALAFTQGYKQGIYDTELKYSQVEPEAWMSNTGKEPSYPLMRIPPVPTLYGTVECASCHKDVVLTEPFDGVDIVCNACLPALAPLKEGD